MNIPIAKNIMTTDILAVDSQWSITQLAEFFEKHNISGAPVTDDHGVLVGVVSLTDIVRYESMPVIDPLSQEPHDYYIRSLQKKMDYQEMSAYKLDSDDDTCVKDIMTPAIFSIEEQTPVPEIADMMIKGHIHRVFVIRNKRIVGIISSLDLLKVVRDLPVPSTV